MSKRTWHKGPPPHVGWWNASVGSDANIWRWWNGEFWSYAADPWNSIYNVIEFANTKSEIQSIEWTDYYPPNARVPRIDPRKPK